MCIYTYYYHYIYIYMYPRALRATPPPCLDASINCFIDSLIGFVDSLFHRFVDALIHELVTICGWRRGGMVWWCMSLGGLDL